MLTLWTLRSFKVPVTRDKVVKVQEQEQEYCERDEVYYCSCLSYSCIVVNFS